MLPMRYDPLVPALLWPCLAAYEISWRAGEGSRRVTDRQTSCCGCRLSRAGQSFALSFVQSSDQSDTASKSTRLARAHTKTTPCKQTVVRDLVSRIASPATLIASKPSAYDRSDCELVVRLLFLAICQSKSLFSSKTMIMTLWPIDE